MKNYAQRIVAALIAIAARGCVLGVCFKGKPLLPENSLDHAAVERVRVDAPFSIKGEYYDEDSIA